jgi:hypothetical protein
MKAIAATVVAVVLVVGGVAIAAIAGSRGGHSATATHQAGAGAPEGRGDIVAAAAYLGISRSELRRQLRSGKTLAQVTAARNGRSTAGLAQALVAARAARLSQAVAAGKVPRAQQAAHLARIRKRVATEVSEAAGGLGVGGYVPPAAHYLGISAARLGAELQAGRTLAQVAGSAGGKSVNGLIEALVSDSKAKLAAATASGLLSRTKEAARLATLKRRVTAAVNRVAIAGPGSAAGRSAASAQA